MKSVKVSQHKNLCAILPCPVGQITQHDTLNCDDTLESLAVEQVPCCPPPICCSKKTIRPVGCLTATVGFWTRTAAGSGSCLAEASTDVARDDI